MDPPRLCFLPGAAVPLSRPTFSPRSTVTAPSRRLSNQPHSQRTNSRPHLFHASASEAARKVDDRVTRETPGVLDASFGSIPSLLRNVLSTAVVVASAAGAYKATPSNVRFSTILRPTAAVTAAIAVSATGVVTLRKGPSKAARKYLAQSLAKHGVASSEFIDSANNLSSKFGITEDLALELKQSLYQMFLLAIVDTPAVIFSEISELARLKQSLSLAGPAVGDVHYEACREFYRNTVVVIDSVDDEIGRVDAQAKLDKLTFLSDRMYADKDTEEAYMYEKSRLCKFFRMDDDEYQGRVARVSLPFYKDVIMRACKDSTVTKNDLVAAQATLGVRDFDAERIRTDAYAERVELLIKDKGKVDAADTEYLARLRVVLSVQEERAASALKTLAEPVFRKEIVKALEAVSERTESMASIYGRLALRQTELSFPGDAARSAIADEMTGKAIKLVKMASKYLRVQNVNACISDVGGLLKYVDGVIELMRLSNDDLKDDDVIIRTYLPGVAKSLSSVEPKQMYRLYLSRCLENRQISEEEEKLLARLRAVLSVSETDAMESFNLAAGPVYKKAVLESVKDNIFSDEAKGQLEVLREDLSLPKKTWKTIELEIYGEKLRNLVTGNRILQEGESQELFSFRQFLGLTPVDTAPIHKVCMGPVYEQSVMEAMGPTGIMLDAYKSGLERLRNRLGLTEEDAEATFFKVVKQRMIMYVNRAMDQLEKRQTFRGQNEERDVGEDPSVKRAGAFLGIDAGGLPIELSNLVDFYVRNGIVQEEEVEEEGGEKKKVQKYPITLRKEVPAKVYNELYKQYVIQCFSAQTRGEKQRLFSVLDQLGCILGMQEDEIGKIHSEIGTVIYKNYVSTALQKGPLEVKDTEFLANIEKMLSMKPEQCVKLLKEGKDSRVSAMLEQIFAQPKVLAESVKKSREMATLLEVDIVKDLKISSDQRGKMFNVEVDAAIDTGALTADNQGLIKELQKDLQVTDDAAKEVVLACIQKRTLLHLVQASASLRQGRSENAVSELKTMLRYGKLLPAKVPAPAVSTLEKQELYLLYQADVITDGVIAQSLRDQVNLLKTLFGFSDADLELISV